MLRNYFKIAVRNLRKRRGEAFINIAGLGLGIAAALLIALYARNELTYDRFHEHADDVYLVYKERVTPTGTQPTYDTWVPLLQRMRETFPTVTNGTRVNTFQAWVQQGNRRFQEPVTYVDPGFFEVFTFPLVRGNPDAPLPNENAVVISQAMAQKYFGDTDPLGQVFTVDYAVDYTVTGVLAEVPQNSTLQPEFVVPITSAPDYADFIDEWGQSFLGTYVQLADDASPDALTDQFPAFVAGIWDQEVASRTHFRLLPMGELRNTFAGTRQSAYILLAIAAATILIAGINFVNLATARSLDRAREIGMRKVLGAVRKQIIGQFLGESVLMGLMALVLGLALTQAALPFFNDLYDLALSLSLLHEPLALIGLIGLGAVMGLLAGLYPAVFLSRFRPAPALRGTLPARPGGLRLRHGLVVFQFALSIVLIAGTVVMWNQITYMKQRDLAFDQENVLVLPVELSDFENPEVAAERLQTFKDELARRSDVVAVSSSTHVPGQGSNSFLFARPEGRDPETPARLRWAAVDGHFFDTYGVAFAEGRNFIEGSEQDREQAIILNEAAVNDFGWTEGVGKTVRIGRREMEVVGVVQDYHYQSLVNEVAPIIHFYRPPEGGVHDAISVRLRTDDVAATLDGLETLWARLDPTRAFDYFFVDDTFAQLYQAQERLASVASAFAVLAVLIACLGLFGLARLTVARRTKEIGVRKVLGASVPRVALLLTKDFALLTAVAFVLAAPVAYVALDRWLQDFAYRIDVSPVTLLLAGALALLVALLTVGYQAVKAALADPVKSLRYE